MDYDRILATLPPKLILDPYWEVLNTIDWKILLIVESREFTVEDILAYFSKEIERKRNENNYYCKLLKEAKDVTEETIAYLTNVGLIKIDGDKLVKTIVYSEFIKFLKECFRKSIIRKVSWAIWYLYNQKNLDCFKVSQILDVISDKSIDENAVEGALKRLKLQFRNGSWCLNDEALSKIRDNLRGKISIFWPFFGIFYVRNTRYFKILRGQSCTAYVDIPNEIFQSLVDDLTATDEKCKDKEEFLNKASKIVEYYNKILRSEFEDFIGANINWLSYRIVDIPFTDKSKFGIRVVIKWSEFLKFIEDYAQLNIELWKKYRYISACRRPALHIILRGHELERTQERVREQSSKDIEEILKTFNELINILAVVKNSLVKIQALIQRKAQINYIVLTLQYLAEMSSVIKASKHFIENGVFPACYIEMRKIIENLAWVLFDDILTFRALNFKWILRPYFDIPVEWHYLKSKFADISDIGKARDIIRKDFMRGIRSLRHDNIIKDVITDSILKNLSYPLFIALFGKDASNIEQNIRGILPIIKTTEILDVAQRDLQRILNNLNLDRDAVNEVLNKLKTTLPSEIIIPFPSNRFVLEFIDNTFSTNLHRFYNEYSFFVHSYFTSWHVMPFSSILEVKIFRHELSKFSNEIQKLFKNYVNSLNRIAKSISKF